MNFLAKVKNKFVVTKNKLAVKVMSCAVAVCCAVSCLAMSAFAEGEASNAIDTVVTSMQTQLTDLVSKAAVAIAAIVGIGLTIFAVKWIVGVLKSFFSKLAR